MRKMKLKTGMILWIWAVAAALFLAILWVDFITTKEAVEDEIEEDAINLARYYSKCVDEILAEIVSATRVMAKQIEVQYKTGDIDRRETLELYIKNVVDTNPFVDCAVIGFEPYAYDENTEKYAPYYYENNYRFNEEDYNYFEREWYKGSKESGRPFWTEPYYAYDTNIMMITYSEPFFKDGKFMGAVGLDVTLERLRNKIEDLKILETGYGFVLSKDGFLISYPDKTKGFGNNISEFSPDLAKEIDKLITLESENYIFLKMKDPLRKVKSWIVLRPLRTYSNRLLGVKTMMGSVGFVYPQKEILSLIYALQRKTIYTAIIGLIILLVIIITISNSISGPITRLAEGVMRVARGDLDYKLSAKAGFLEVDTLQAAFNKMSTDLKAYIKNLKEAIEKKERIEGELKIARQIQASMIPNIFPPFPKKKEFELFATMEPAREVGGDIYDFFLVGENKLCFLIGDVSGKGIPAALFMVIIKILLKNEAGNGLAPDEILYKVNNLLCPDNKECMFATIFCALLDIRTGEVQFANAGHNPPLIGRKSETGYSFEFMKVNSNFVAGAEPNTKFALEKAKLGRGDMIFLYTDGVTEAVNPDSQYFSEKRLKEALSRIKDESVGSIIRNIQGRITEFTKSAEQSDDITMLVLKYVGPA